jgi:hypothetical protein
MAADCTHKMVKDTYSVGNSLTATNIIFVYGKEYHRKTKTIIFVYGNGPLREQGQRMIIRGKRTAQRDK